MGWEVQEMCSRSVHNVHNKVGSSVHNSIFSLTENQLILKEITSLPSSFVDLVEHWHLTAL